MLFARLPDDVLDIKFPPFAGIELSNANRDFRAQRIELIEIIDQLSRDAVLIRFRQRFNLGDGLSENFRHYTTLASSPPARYGDHFS
jgi:hypothetical protein